MPKRRLSQERGGGKNNNKSKSLSQQLQLPPAQLEIQEQQPPPKSPPPPQPRPHRPSQQHRAPVQPSEFLIKLSAACTKHSKNHHHHGHFSSRNGGRKNNDDDDDHDDAIRSTPAVCRKELDTLTKLLPKVEDAFEPPAPGEAGPCVYDVANLCDFYVSVLRGTYCPHMPTLFDLGRKPLPVLRRVMYLFRHIVTPAVLRTARSIPTPSDDETSLRSVVDIISRTIGHLLSFLVDTTVYPYIVSDILDMLLDCNKILDVHYHHSMSSSAAGVRLVILDGTHQHFQLSGENDNNNNDNNNNNFLELSSDAEVWLLQAAAFTILQTFLEDEKSKRLLLDAIPPERVFGPAYSSGATIDALLFHADLLLTTTTGTARHDTIITGYLNVIQQILLSSEHKGGGQHRDYSSSSSATIPIWQRRQFAALKMLLLIVDDLHNHHMAIPSPTLLHEASSTTARVVLAYLRKQLQLQQQARRNYPEYAVLLATLLNATVLDPPGIQIIIDNNRSGGRGGQTRMIMSTLPFLLDCIDPIAKRRRRRRRRSEKFGRDYNTTDDDNDIIILETTIMRILDSVLKQNNNNTVSNGADTISSSPSSPSSPSPIQSFAANYCTRNGLYRPLIVDLMRDPMLSNFAVGIFGSLSKKTFRFHDLESLCSAAAIELHDQTGELKSSEHSVADTASTVNKSASSSTENSAGSKRKRQCSTATTSPVRESLSPSRNHGRTDTRDRESNSSDPDSHSFSLLASVRILLRDALAAGKSRSFLLDDSSSHGNVTLIMGAMKCVCYTMFIQQSTNRQDLPGDIMKGCFQVIKILSGYLKSWCDHLVLTKLDSLSNLDMFVVEIASNSALFLHYTVLDTLLTKRPDGGKDLQANVSGIASACLKFATCKLQQKVAPIYTISNECPRSRRMHYVQCVTGMKRMEKGEVDPKNNCRQPLCLCTHFDQSDTAKYIHRDDSDLLRTSSLTDAISVLESLPARTRYCLLWSQALRFGSSRTTDPMTKSAQSKWLEELESISTVIKDNLEGTAPGDDRHSTGLCLLSLTPALLVSLAYSASKQKDTTDKTESNRSSQGHAVAVSRNFRDLSCRFIKKTLGLVLTSASASDDLYETILLAVKRIQSRRDTENWYEHGTWEATASSTVDFLLGRNALCEENCDYPAVPEFDGLLNRFLHDVAKMVQVHGQRSFPRKLLWGCMADLVRVAPPSELRRIAKPKSSNGTHFDANANESIAHHWLSWLLDAPFSDADEELRKYAAAKIARVITHNGFAFLLAVFASNKDLAIANRYSDVYYPEQSIDVELQTANDRIAADFFRQIDHLITGKCGISDSILSFTLARSTASETLSNGSSLSLQHNAGMQKLAARILASLCQNANLNHLLGRGIFTGAYRRLARLWASNADTRENSSIPKLPSTGTCRALSFGELSTFSQAETSVLSDPIIASIFSDLWALNADRDIDVRYGLLANFIQSFLLERRDILARKQILKATSSYFEARLATFICYLIGEKIKEEIFLTAGFRDFLIWMIKDAKKTFGFESLVIGASNAPNQYPSISSRDLEKKARTMCLEPNLIDRILPCVLPDNITLKFFLGDILDLKLGDLIEGRKQKIMKSLVWELGRDETSSVPTRRAIKVVSMCAIQAESAGDDGLASVVSGSSVNSLVDANGLSVASHWVTSNFMYLMVNLIQHQRNAENPADQLHALRCLYELIDYVIPSAAAEYFPQILATVNTATAENASIECPESACIRHQATKCLSKFVEVVAVHQVEAVAQNLTNIVVSLIPLLEEDSIGPKNEQTRTIAVSLLEFLANGELGKTLAPHFREIPFLPRIGILGNVHKALRDNGVDNDNLMVLSSATQEGKTEGVSTADSSATSESRASSSLESSSSEKVPALQKRLNTICVLLNNENKSVRNVALQHLIDLLRGNRGHFHALVESESITTTNMYLTTTFHDRKQNEGNGSLGHRLSPRGTATKMVDILLSRCVQEGDPKTRLLLATCLGEIGAIGEHHLGDMGIGGAAGDDSLKANKWRLEQPPWQSRSTKYELQLLTHHLVIGLKASATSVDQHRIIFTIQCLLHQLDQTTAPSSEPNKRNAEMGDWLRGNLKEANALDILEPFWTYEFTEKAEGYVQKQPPFFTASPSSVKWMSNFCRWMIYSAHDTPQSPWRNFFFNCRQAVRSEVGLQVAEFLFPVLILDRLCFGSSSEEQLIREEFLAVLNFDRTVPAVSMNQTDRQKSVSAFFSVMDTLTYWAEMGTEARHKSSRASSSRHGKRKSSRGDPAPNEATSWPADDTISRIDEFISTIPLDKQARAASRVGMHARALRLLEFAGRKETVRQIYESVGNSGQVPKHADDTKANIELRKELLAKLDDCDSMVAVGEDHLPVASSLQVHDSIRRKEASGDFEGALKDYERALQLEGAKKQDLDLETGALKCLLELGHFESVLKQAAGLVACGGEYYAKPFAIEAAWRLGRWETLSQLVQGDDMDKQNRKQSFRSYDKHREFVGKIFLGMFKRDCCAVEVGVQKAREASMEALSIVGRENYARSYSEIVKLHCLRELENAAEFFFEQNKPGGTTLDEVAHSKASEGWRWDERLDLATSRGASSIMSTRVALARIDSEPVLEGSLFLRIGKQARKHRLYGIAENFLSQAESVLSAPGTASMNNQKLGDLLYSARVQVAKLKHECGESTLALRLLGQESVQAICDKMLPHIDNETKIRQIAVQYEKNRMVNAGVVALTDSDAVFSERFVSRLLKTTQWMIEGGLTGGSEVIGRFRVIHKLSPQWEKGHFQFGKFVESLMKARVTALASKYASAGFQARDEDSRRSCVVASDPKCQKYITQSMVHYVAALKISTKHVYQALPRLLSAWFEFTSIQSHHLEALFSDKTRLEEFARILKENKSLASGIIARDLKPIPASAFYTAMPQLISRVTHDDTETALVVQSVLQRVLTKFPLEAMWPLAWLKGSKNAERSKIGEEIFKKASKMLRKSNRKMEKLLGGADSLFKFLRDLAMFSGGDSHQSSISIKPWAGTVELSEFIPPVQAALSVSPGVSDAHHEFFPRNVPRMRRFCSKIGVMSSKAKPKKLKAFVVPAGRQASNQGSHTHPEPGDIGEIHFLVKQEAKGDLRKDARVQDLNNVINRLMSSTTSSAGSTRSKRRLRLRTFAVTCLSEDTGILEWVPDTESLRNLITKTYNPQVSSFSTRRRGERIGNFSETSLRNSYERAQNMYFREGNLARAGAAFEELCSQYPPLLYWWFVQKFRDPHAWYEARNSFALSTAAWSAVGHVIGLGDRHSENILVDTTSGQCVHVDFDCIFDKGLDLPRPEVIPFRLTQNMLDAFGPTGSDGIYSSGLQSAMTVLRDNRDTLLSVLEPFTKDPVIDWRRNKGQQKSTQSTIEDYQKSRAKRAINVIDERLQGIYNLRNPNVRKYKRRDGQQNDDHDDIPSMSPLSVDGQVHKLIAEATNNENLIQLYVGWMPWV